MDWAALFIGIDCSITGGAEKDDGGGGGGGDDITEEGIAGTTVNGIWIGCGGLTGVAILSHSLLSNIWPLAGIYMSSRRIPSQLARIFKIPGAPTFRSPTISED